MIVEPLPCFLPRGVSLFLIPLLFRIAFSLPHNYPTHPTHNPSHRINAIAKSRFPRLPRPELAIRHTVSNNTRTRAASHFSMTSKPRLSDTRILLTKT
jgi:hypothetical protein